MSLSEMPIGLALISCDTVIEDRRSGKKSLIGLFGQLNVRKLPYIHPSMSLFVSMTGGTGEHACEVLCSSAGQKNPVFSVKGKIKFDHPQQVIDMVFQLQSIRFPQADTYWIKVIVDEVPLMMRPLVVVQHQKPAAPGEAKEPPGEIK
jgi:hypothetical protein